MGLETAGNSARVQKDGLRAVDGDYDTRNRKERLRAAVESSADRDGHHRGVVEEIAAAAEGRDGVLDRGEHFVGGAAG